MLYQSLVLLAVTLASISAFPANIGKRDWDNDKNGNLKLTFSDETIQLGTIEIKDIISKLTEACSTSGLCDTNSIKIKGQLISPGRSGDVKDETLTIEPSGDYQVKHRQGLLDALSAAVNVIAKCKDVTNTPTCPNSIAFCPSEPFTVTQCTVPQYWGINYQPPDLGNAAPPFIEADLTIVLDDDGFCETFTTIGSAVAGAVSGVAGGAFTLASLLCKS